MSELNQLLARSRAPGAFVERRRFTLSRSLAVEKLREFALRDPHQYILELIQGAVFAGAESVGVEVDAGALVLAWVGGRPLTREQITGIFDYLFADRSDADSRHLVQLAVGLNALLQRRPSAVRIESGDGSEEGTLRVDLDASGAGVLGPVREPIYGTYVSVRYPAAALRRAVAGPLTPEQALIEERCLYTPIPILLNGQAPFGHLPDRNLVLFSVRDQLFFDTGARRGVLGVPIGSDSHRFRVVVGGVWITTLDLPELGSVSNTDWEVGSFREPFIGVLCDDGLKKTADQSDVVRDARFGALLGAVRPFADELSGRLSRRGQPLLSKPRREEDRLRMLGARGWLEREALAALPESAPLFYVDPSHTAWLSGPADPLRFPFRVLTLDSQAADRLQEALPGHTLHKLGGPEEVDFVRRVLIAEQEIEEQLTPLRLPTPVPMEGDLALRLHLDGAAPAWGPPEQGVPALITHQGRSEWSGALPLALPALSVHFHADSLARVGEEALRAALTREVKARVADALTPAVLARPGGRALALAVLALATRPRRVSGGRLYAALAGGWGGGVAELRSAALIGDGEQRCSLAQWTALPAGRRPPLPGPLADWAALARAEVDWRAALVDPEAPGWLAREEVRAGALRGWLGLALPFEDEARVEVRREGRDEAPVALSLPCLGVIRAGAQPLSAGQQARLRLAVARLHRRLADQLERESDPTRRRAGERYLERWRRSPAPAPAPTPNPAAELTARLERALLDLPGSRVLRLRLADRDGAPVSVDREASEGRLVVLTLSGRHPAVRAALRPGEPRELLLLEALRLTCDWLTDQGHPTDFLEAQQNLLAGALVLQRGHAAGS
jgi:hypothetical protein